MKKKFAWIFVLLEGAMLAIVMGSFVVRHTETSSSYSYGVYFGEDYPLTETYEVYRDCVLARKSERAASDEATIANEATASDEAATSNETAASDTAASSNESAIAGEAVLSDPSAEVNQSASEEVVESQVYKSIMGINEPSGSLFQRLSAMITAAETKIENYTNSQKILGKETFIETQKTLDLITGLDMTASLTMGENSDTDVRDVVAETEEQQLGWVQDDYDITESLENLVDFGLQMEAEGRNFVLMQNPNKYAETDAFRDYSAEKYQQIEDTWTEAGLRLVDLGEELKGMGLTEKNIFFDTDFHWKPQAGVLADGIAARYLNENFGYSINTELYSLDQYSVETETNGFLGHLGKKVSLSYTEPDDFPILYPGYETDYTVYNSYDGSQKTGSVDETLYWYERLDEDSLYDGNKYEFYGYSDQTLISIHNNRKSDGKHLLVLKESYANCMIPYLAADIEQVDVIDLRLFSGSIREYIRDTDPDTVLMLYGLSSYEADTIEEGLFDFR